MTAKSKLIRKLREYRDDNAMGVAPARFTFRTGRARAMKLYAELIEHAEPQSRCSAMISNDEIVFQTADDAAVHLLKIHGFDKAFQQVCQNAFETGAGAMQIHTLDGKTFATCVDYRIRPSTGEDAGTPARNPACAPGNAMGEKSVIHTEDVGVSAHFSLLKQENAKLTANLGRLAKTIDEMKFERAKEGPFRHKHEFERLQRDYDLVTQANRIAHGKITALKEDLDFCRANHQIALSVANNLRDDLASANRECAVLQNQISELKKQTGEIYGELRSERAAADGLRRLSSRLEANLNDATHRLNAFYATGNASVSVNHSNDLAALSPKQQNSRPAPAAVFVPFDSEKRD
jgi:hypothetical protein